jgi:hypothetical protein
MSADVQPAPLVEATRRYVVADAHYVVVEADGGFAWRWREPDGDEDFAEGRSWPTVSGALRAAADDWDATGSGGDLAARLRSAATQYERHGR